MNDNSILDTIKKLLGIQNEAFDTDIIIHINSTFMILHQLGIGPTNGFQISGSAETWEQFIGTSSIQLSSIRSYVYLRVKMVFDPSASSVVTESLERTLREYEWRLQVNSESAVLENNS